MTAVFDLKNLQLKRILLLLTIALMLFSFTRVWAQDHSFKIIPDTNTFRIGEQMKMKMIFELPTSVDFQIPFFKDTIIKQLEVVNASDLDTIYPKNDISKVILEQIYTVTSFDTGIHVVPPFGVVIGDDTIYSAPFAMEVKSMDLGEKAEMKDIKDPLEISFSFLEFFLDYWHWIIGVALLILLIVIYFVYFKNRRKETFQEGFIKPKIPAHEISLNKLKELEKKSLLEKGDVKLYHIEVSEILREYLEKRYLINAMEQTTAEIFQNLHFVELSGEEHSKLNKILQLSDFVKFAKAKPSIAESQLSLKHAIEFVEATKRIVDDIVPTNEPKDKEGNK